MELSAKSFAKITDEVSLLSLGGLSVELDTEIRFLGSDFEPAELRDHAGSWTYDGEAKSLDDLAADSPSCD